MLASEGHPVEGKFVKWAPLISNIICLPPLEFAAGIYRIPRPHIWRKRGRPPTRGGSECISASGVYSMLVGFLANVYGGDDGQGPEEGTKYGSDL